MRIGKDEIGAIGIFGLILFLPGSFLIAYGLLRTLLYSFIGVFILVLAVALYYGDLLAHRRRKKRL